MKCPNCLSPVNFARQKCPRCGVDYQHAFEQRAWSKPPAHAHHKAHGQRHRRRAGYAWLAAPAAVLLVWSLLAPPAGLPLPARAYQSAPHGFAFSPPEGWALEAGEVPHGDIVSSARLAHGPVLAEVLVGPRWLCDEAASRGGALRLAQGVFNGAEVALVTNDEVSVDGLPARRIRVSGGRTTLPSVNAGRQSSPLARPAPRFESLEFAGELVVVPGAGRSYLLKTGSDRDSLARERPALDGLVSSFRVTRRPFSFGHLREFLTGAAP